MQQPSSSALNSRLRDVLRHDLPASLVVFLIALPLSLGIALASNAPLLAGLIAAIVGGVVAGAIGGSPLQVSGPAAGLTVVVAGLIAEFGWAATCAITAAAGVLQVILGLSRVARAALAISPVVVHAMLAGIGITIALQQVHVLLGGSSKSSAWKNVTELPGQLLGAHAGGFFLGAMVVVLLVAWRKAPGWLARMPAPLVAVVAVTVVSVVFPFDVERIELNGSLLDAVALPALPDGNWAAVTIGILTLALIASVESLLSAVSVDKMHRGKRTDFNRELIGQGTANIASGAIGGLPITGVIVRSASNVRAGAKTRASAILHGVWVLLFAVPFAPLAEQIPTSVLAGLLVVIGVQLVQLAHIETARRTGDIAVYLVTVFGVVFLNLLEGVLIGLGLAVAQTVWRVVRARIHAERVDTDEWRITVDGSCTFLSVPKLTGMLASIPAGAAVTIELSVDFLDHAAREAIDEWERHHLASGGTVHIHDVGAVAMDTAKIERPTRGFAPIDKRSGVVPWSSWQRHRQDGTPRPIHHGLAVYHRRTAPYIRPHMKELEHAQRPETLFITCTDSRIVPNLITSSGPGDLFTVRNVGNFIAAGRRDPSIEAAIAFAVEKLRVSSIVVCGHSSCGAMNALLAEQVSNSNGIEDPLNRWLVYGDAALAAFRSGRHPVAQTAAAAGFGVADQLSMVNVAVQVEELRNHPVVTSARGQRGLGVIGWFYDIPSAEVLLVAPADVMAPTGSRNGK